MESESEVHANAVIALRALLKLTHVLLFGIHYKGAHVAVSWVFSLVVQSFKTHSLRRGKLVGRPSGTKRTLRTKPDDFDYTSGRAGAKNNAEQPLCVPEPQLSCGKLPNGPPARKKTFDAR